MRFYCANFDDEQWTRTKHLTNFQPPPLQNTTMRIDFFGRFSPMLSFSSFRAFLFLEKRALYVVTSTYRLRVPQELDTTFTGFQWIDNERNNYD